VLIAVFCKNVFARDSKKYPARVVTYLNNNIKSIAKNGIKNINVGLILKGTVRPD
jgi:hypothetical protein